MTRIDTLLREFDRMAGPARTALTRRYGADEGETIVAAALEEFRGLAPEIPYTDRPRDTMAGNISGPYGILAYVLVMRRRGRSREEIGAFIDEGFEVPLPFAWVPASIRARVMKLALPLLRWRFRRDAEASARRDEPDEFRWELVDEPGADLALNITRCAVCTAFGKHDASDVVPYICALDDRVSSTLGLGLSRTGTRALGATHCDFRYRVGAEGLPLDAQYDLPRAPKSG